MEACRVISDEPNDGGPWTADRLAAELIDEELRARASVAAGLPATPLPFEGVPHPSEASPPLDDDDGKYRMTELGNAQRLADANVGRLRFVHDWRTWLAWDGQRWRRDASGAEHEAAKLVVEQLFAIAEHSKGEADRFSAEFAEVLSAGNSTERSEEAKKARAQAQESTGFKQAKRAREQAGLAQQWAMASSTAKVIGNMVKLARSEPRLVGMPSEFDADRWVLNVQNGTLDLRTGHLRPHRQADMITKLASARYDPSARAPRWERFLEQVQPDLEMRTWLQRFMGYCLTGSVNEQVMMFALGVGNNGKNVLFDTMLAAMGDYAMVAAPDLLVLKHNDEHPTAFADLQGHRMVVVSEIDQGRKWAEAAIKRLTGDATIKARRMRQDFYEFPATHKFLVMANAKPDVRGTDNGIWRRILLTPFDVTIPEKDRDSGLIGTLKAELDGILAWAVRGCIAWQRDGLGSVPAIKNAVAEYRRDQDIVGEWISERCVCVCHPSMRLPMGGFCDTCRALIKAEIVSNEAPREPWTSLYPDFRGWLEARGQKPWTLPGLRGELVKRPGMTVYRTKTDRGVAGIKLRYLPGAGWSTRPDYSNADDTSVTR